MKRFIAWLLTASMLFTVSIASITGYAIESDSELIIESDSEYATEPDVGCVRV